VALLKRKSDIPAYALARTRADGGFDYYVEGRGAGSGRIEPTWVPDAGHATRYTSKYAAKQTRNLSDLDDCAPVRL
jgi:hypothetical protein